MGLMNKLSSSMSNTAKSFSKVSNNMIEISKLNLSIKRREEEIREKFEEIGQYVYGRLKRMNMINRIELVELISEIHGLEEDISSLEKLILNLKGVNLCEACEIELDDEAKYCPLCGKRLKN
ncbi:hypothetical protein F8154_06850 [Alkaliphilus pronyensis]|uniref:Zinc ribbon domain-containing protein n=1 Tax=Alkaliphilus pronyensis TaxID=1482732 RepID=A0A6I0F920_9FIRM|nr:hypothetical protein [Alkaliphilus pronyensis]KAB3535303.1 hypothetical protein F8154_06850 [Alkaliphilus pronyensis]